MPLERLQKIISAAGIASRRKSEELITQGLVEVNGKPVTELGAKADPDHDHIRVNGKLLQAPDRKTVILLHKPKGYVTTVSDPEGRPTVLDLVKRIGKHVYPVGRLDYASEGLLLLTNDGELADLLTRAASHVPKTYLVKVSGKPEEKEMERLRSGILLRPRPVYGDSGRPIPGKVEKGVRTAPAKIELFRDAPNPWYEVTLIEGRNRQIRRMFEEIGHHVEKIKRVRYGTLELDVESGAFRELTTREVESLRRSARSTRPRATPGAKPRTQAGPSPRRKRP